MIYTKKILFIGDIHGRDEWLKIANDALLNFCHVVFLGDYIDSFDISAANQIHNFKSIIEFKKKYSDKVTLLLGNHDWAYLYDEPNISGFQHKYRFNYKQLFLEDNNIDLFDVAWGHTNHKTDKYTLATHAGLTYDYYKDIILPKLSSVSDASSESSGLTTDTPLHEILNALKGSKQLWKIGFARGGYGTGSPLWADYRELLDDPYPNINQVFGHTALGNVSVTQFGDYFLAKIDGNFNNKLSYLQINI